jgi:CubicO group peptidase (beta-lactamase class C family)
VHRLPDLPGVDRARSIGGEISHLEALALQDLGAVENGAMFGRSGDDVCLEGELRPIRPTQDVTWAAAAGIKSNAIDMAKWIGMQLNRGLLDNGKRLFSEANSREMWSAQIALPIRDGSGPLKATTPNFSAYGLGWNLRDYRGRKVVSHGGALTGMVSSVTMIPEEKLGIIILSNQEENGALSAILYHILDHYLGIPAMDWIEAYHSSTMQERTRANAAEKKMEQARAADSKPS